MSDKVKIEQRGDELQLIDLDTAKPCGKVRNNGLEVLMKLGSKRKYVVISWNVLNEAFLKSVRLGEQYE